MAGPEDAAGGASVTAEPWRARPRGKALVFPGASCTPYVRAVCRATLGVTSGEGAPRMGPGWCEEVCGWGAWWPLCSVTALMSPPLPSAQ